MPTDTPAAPPGLDPALLDALRRDLRAAEYTVEAAAALYGEMASEALRRENPIPARRRLRGLTTPLATLLSVFTLGAAAPHSRLAAALPTLGVAGAVSLGLLAVVPAADPAPGEDLAAGDPVDDPDPLLRATIDLSPYAARDNAGEIAWWIASDLSELATGNTLHPEHVLGVGGASLTLARLTPRERVGRVLDLGCGGGIQALHAARHAEHVVATDLSERALAFAAFNAALNGLEIELRQGSLLEPVAGETFDLVISNPPFVITPRRAEDPGGAKRSGGWTYRDGGRTGDTLLAELLAQLPAHLAPGGRAVMLGNWEIAAGALGNDGDADADVDPEADAPAWDAHPRAWLEPAREAGVDAWVIQREREDPARYAETWARDGGVTERDAAWTELQEAWLEDFADRDVAGIGFGYLLLQRPAETTRPAVLRTEEVTGTGTGTLATHLWEGMGMIQALASWDDEALEAARPVRAADVVERRHLTPGEVDPMLIELVQGAGFARSVPADQVLAATVGALDGTLTLGQVVGAVCALTGDDTESARQRVNGRLRELMITGMVHR